VLRAVLFDFNGVLLDDEPLHAALFDQVLREEGLTLTAEEYFRDYLGLDDRGCFEEVYRRAGLPLSREQLARLIARKNTYYQETIERQGFPFFPEAAQVVSRFHRSGLRLGLVSGALRSEIRAALRAAGWEAAFPIVVAAEDVERSKPDPEGYRKALELLNREPRHEDSLIHPHEVVAVEDSPAGIEAALAAGLHAVAVAHTYGPGRLRKAARIFPRLAAVDPDSLKEVAS
jgi:HAD superfamily hydrolase (TIGR01509 family)